MTYSEENKNDNHPAQGPYMQQPITGPQNQDAKKEQKRLYKEQKKKNRAEKQSARKDGWHAKIIALCISASFVFATLGGYFGSYIQEQTSDDTAVLYQSVIRTVSTETSDSTTFTVSEVVSLVSDSIVEITTETVSTGIRMQQYITEGAGSGVIISTDGYIVTNYHVIEDASTIIVTLSSEVSYEAEVVGTDEEADIAVLKIETDNLTAAVLGDSDTLAVGETAIAIGNPLGELGGTVTSGIISALDREITIDDETMSLLQIDAAINPGNSGGGLFNTRGELIGIVNAKSTGVDVEGLGFAIPINSVADKIEDIISYGYVKGKVSMGVAIIDIDDKSTADYYNVNNYGVYVVEVESGSNAARAGIEAGDFILSIDGIQIGSTSELKNALSELSIGDEVSVTILRDGNELTKTMKIKES